MIKFDCVYNGCWCGRERRKYVSRVHIDDIHASLQVLHSALDTHHLRLDNMFFAAIARPIHASLSHALPAHSSKKFARCGGTFILAGAHHWPSRHFHLSSSIKKMDISHRSVRTERDVSDRLRSISVSSAATAFRERRFPSRSISIICATTGIALALSSQGIDCDGKRNKTIYSYAKY